MAHWTQHVTAFFDPTVAVNEDGYLVGADGFFDNGDGSTDYLVDDELSGVRNFLYGSETEGIFDYSQGFAPSDTESFSDFDNYASDALDAANDAALQQQQAAQSSADRSMEYENEQFDKYTQWQERMAETAWNREMKAANTSYQRMMADLKAAGLNPKLAGKLGGAMTPSYDIDSTYAARGSSASMSMSNLSVLGSVLGAYITGADAMDRNQNDFLQDTISDILRLVGISMMVG